MSEENETFADLLALIGDGDAKSEKILIERFSKSVLYVLYSRTQDMSRAEDICQETMRLILEKFRKQGRKGINDPTKLPTYIHQTAINLLLAENRKNQRRNTVIDSTLLDDVESEQKGPFDEVQLISLRNSIMDCLAELKNERDRELLFRYYIEESGKEKICEDMNLDNRYFDKVIHRARTRLRKVLEGKKNILFD